MVVAKAIEVLSLPEPKTRLKVVRDGKKSHSIPIPPISPSTPMISKKRIYWQLQFDFTQPLQPLELPAKTRKPRERKVISKAVPATPSPERKQNRLQKLKSLLNTETEDQKAARLAKGLHDRTAFLDWIENGIDHLKNEPIYVRFKKIARSETLRELNKTRTLRGLADWEAEEIWMDHYHTTILKVAEALGDGVHDFKDGQVRFDDYFFTFLVADAKRNVHNLDDRNINHRYIYQDNGDDDTRDIWGVLGVILSEMPTFMEGRMEEFRQYAHYEIFRLAEIEYPKSDGDFYDVLFFRTYYGAKRTLKQVSEELGFSIGAITKGRDKVVDFVRKNLDWHGLQEQFGLKIMEGCDCG